MNFTRMFNPRGIAVVGANPDVSRPGRQTVLALERHGYKGGVYPVNPKYPEIGGRRCLPSLADIEGPVVFGLPVGHVEGPALTLPLGVSVRVVGGTTAEVIIEEAAVA